MRFCAQVFLIAVATSNAYGQGQTLRKTLMHDGVERRYNLYVPSTYSADQALPLVLNVHGLGRDGNEQMNSSRMNAVAEREGFLAVYPSAISGSWANSPDLNISFFDSLLDTINSNYSVDASRIYSTGLSQGAIISYLLAVERPETFAAIAPVGGVRPLRENGTLFPSGLPHVPNRPFPLLHVHGTADDVVPIEGGSGISVFPSVDSVLSEWLANNNCETSPIVTELPDARPTDRFTVTLLSHEDCVTYTGASNSEHSAEVQFYRVNSGGHYWPNDPIFDTSNAVWDFFSRHELPKSGVMTHPLLPGDADQDLDFDQLDLVAVQQSAKYLTGQPATWGEGDWNGGPGGEPGNPPAGDGQFNQFDIIAANLAGNYLQGPYAAVNVGRNTDDGPTFLTGDAKSAQMLVDAAARQGLTSINMTSASGGILGDNPSVVEGAFDVLSANNLIPTTFGDDFGSTSLASVLPVGMNEVDETRGLSAVGSLPVASDLDGLDLIYVPEPSSILMVVLTTIGSLGLSRRNRLLRAA